MTIDELRRAISTHSQIVVVCGAGISTGAGLPDFKHLYRTTPNLVSALHNKSYKNHAKTLTRFLVHFANAKPQPTPTHAFLSRLESLKKLRRCYTMNIDDLESQVLSRHKVRFVHGRVADTARCGKTRVSSQNLLHMAAQNKIEQYNETHNCHLRPGFVMYGDAARHIDEMDADLQSASVIIVIGTRLQVEPVASMVRKHAAKVICINNEPIANLKTVVGDCNRICSQL